MKSYFAHCRTAEELKAEYKRLALQYHPDVTGDAATEPIMQQINAQYDDAWPRLKDRHESTHEETAGQVYTASQSTAETPEEFRAVIIAVLQMQGVTLELCGRWLWITGNTRPYADTLKALGCRWSPKKVAWNWHTAQDFSFGRGHWTLDKIRNAYGSARIVENEQQVITA